MSDISPIPDDYPRLCPYLCVDGAAAAIEFYASVLGATERMRLAGPGDKVAHAELAFGDSVLMISDEFPEMGALSPASVGGSPVTISLYVEDVDAAYDRALAAGATAVRPVTDQFYGDRSGQFTDPFGHRWSIASRVEQVPPQEMAARMAAMGSD
ncbi:VOC family protein [Frankia sp. AiPs1]|uniref:VOC family protein n=1 Tax=Frankia sp. AiPs1 TaxID=573493 RepID=UPI0020434CAF|nr:VOC family protein [Frankia sp. AiPs1]MCM3923749.1 VOC family protein [Frankia sp. AiPs1]